MRSEIATGGQRPRSFIDEARRKQLVDCTVEALADLGFARTSLSEIARRAGVSKGVISYHFAGKNELIEQVIAQVFKESSDWMQGLISSDAPAFEKLRAYIEDSMAFMKTEPRRLKALMEIFLNFRKADGSLHFDGSEEESTLHFLETILHQGQVSGEFRSFSIRPVALTIKSVVEIVPVRIGLDPALDLDAYAAELVELFWRATRADESSLLPSKGYRRVES